MTRTEKIVYTNTSSVDEGSLKCPKPITSQGAGSRHTWAESKPARWWEVLCPSSSKSMISSEPSSLGEGDFLPLPDYPAEARARTRAIDRYLAAESQRSKRQLKIILFGDEHENSLFLKQTGLFELPLSNEERAKVRIETRRFVASICRECLQIVDEYACKSEWINAHPVLGRVKEIVTCEDPEDGEIVESMVRLYCDDKLRLALKQLGHDLEDIERRFLNDRFPHILTCPCTANGNLSQLLKRVFAPQYVPTGHDWFHFDQRRLGRVVQEAIVHRDNHTLRLLRITDRSTQRRKWIHILEDDRENYMNHIDREYVASISYHGTLCLAAFSYIQAGVFFVVDDLRGISQPFRSFAFSFFVFNPILQLLWIMCSLWLSRMRWIAPLKRSANGIALLSLTVISMTEFLGSPSDDPEIRFAGRALSELLITYTIMVITFAVNHWIGDLFWKIPKLTLAFLPLVLLPLATVEMERDITWEFTWPCLLAILLSTVWFVVEWLIEQKRLALTGAILIRSLMSSAVLIPILLLYYITSLQSENIALRVWSFSGWITIMWSGLVFLGLFLSVFTTVLLEDGAVRDNTEFASMWLYASLYLGRLF